MTSILQVNHHIQLLCIFECLEHIILRNKLTYPITLKLKGAYGKSKQPTCEKPRRVPVYVLQRSVFIKRHTLC